MAITHTHCGPMVGQQIVLRLLLKWKCTNIIVLFAYCYYSHFSCYSTHTRSLGGLVNNNNNADQQKQQQQQCCCLRSSLSSGCLRLSTACQSRETSLNELHNASWQCIWQILRFPVPAFSDKGIKTETNVKQSQCNVVSDAHTWANKTRHTKAAIKTKRPTTSQTSS